MSEERDRLERAKAKMNELTLGREYDAAWRAVLSALEAAKAEMERRERDTALAYPGAVPGHWKAHAERQQQRAEAAEAENAALRAEVERLKATVLKQDEALRRGHDRDVIVTRERDESRARAARLEMALRGQATRLLPDGGVCYCDIQRSDECRNEPPCVEARAALASGESREGETCWLIEAPAGAWGWQSVHWWCGQQEGGAEWTADATIAVRFLRREDAEAVLNFLTDQLIEVGGGVRVTEHVFLRRALASGESREEATIKESLIVHPFTPCRLLCTVCGLPEDKHPASAGPAEEPGRETR